MFYTISCHFGDLNSRGYQKVRQKTLSENTFIQALKIYILCRQAQIYFGFLHSYDNYRALVPSVQQTIETQY